MPRAIGPRENRSRRASRWACAARSPPCRALITRLEGLAGVFRTSQPEQCPAAGKIEVGHGGIARGQFRLEGLGLCQGIPPALDSHQALHMPAANQPPEPSGSVGFGGSAVSAAKSGSASSGWSRRRAASARQETGFAIA